MSATHRSSSSRKSPAWHQNYTNSTTMCWRSTSGRLQIWRSTMSTTPTLPISMEADSHLDPTVIHLLCTSTVRVYEDSTTDCMWSDPSITDRLQISRSWRLLGLIISNSFSQWRSGSLTHTHAHTLLRRLSLLSRRHSRICYNNSLTHWYVT